MLNISEPFSIDLVPIAVSLNVVKIEELILSAETILFKYHFATSS